ncbi:MAG: SseB family protein, partial [Planctomycetota bacterium]
RRRSAGMTRLDAAITALQAQPEDETRLRAVYAALAGTELCLLLAQDAEGDTITPKVFPLETGPVVLAFDSEERLSDFAGAAPFAALSGRAAAELLSGRGLSLGLNLGTAAEYIVAAEALAWLLEQRVALAQSENPPVAFHPPAALPEHLLPEIEARLAAQQGLARQAVLVDARYADGTTSPLIGFIAAQDGAEPALSALIGEVLAIAGLDPAAWGIGFFEAKGALTDRMIATGLVIDIPMPSEPPTPDPSRPPRLR